MEMLFLVDLRTCHFHECFELSDSEQAYENFKQLFLDITNKLAPVKTKMIRGNSAPFMNKELMYQSIPCLTIPPGDPGDSHVFLAPWVEFSPNFRNRSSLKSRCYCVVLYQFLHNSRCLLYL